MNKMFGEFILPKEETRRFAGFHPEKRTSLYRDVHSGIFLLPNGYALAIADHTRFAKCNQAEEFYRKEEGYAELTILSPSSSGQLERCREMLDYFHEKYRGVGSWYDWSYGTFELAEPEEAKRLFLDLSKLPKHPNWRANLKELGSNAFLELVRVRRSGLKHEPPVILTYPVRGPLWMKKSNPVVYKVA